jgi:hypothetical protein
LSTLQAVIPAVPLKPTAAGAPARNTTTSVTFRNPAHSLIIDATDPAAAVTLAPPDPGFTGDLAVHGRGAGDTITINRPLTLAGNLLFTGSLNFQGPLTSTAGNVALSTPNRLTLSQNITVANNLVVTSAGGVSQTGGVVRATGLALQGTGAFTLDQPGNQVQTLAANIGGPLSYTNAGGLGIGSVELWPDFFAFLGGILTGGSPISIRTVNGPLTVFPGNQVDAGSQTLFLQAGSAPGSANALTLGADFNAGGPTVLTGDGGVTLVGDQIAVGPDPTEFVVFAGAGVTLRPFTAGRAIDLGGPGSAGALSLSNDELSGVRLFGPLQIGDAASGPITVTAPLDLTGITNTLTLVTGQSIGNSSSGGPALTVPQLILQAPGGIGSAAAPLTTAAQELAATAGGTGIFIANSGDLTLGDVTAGSGDPRRALGGPVPLQISSDGTLTVAGTVAAGSGGLLALSGAGGVVIAGGGVLAGPGTVTGNLTNSGVLEPGGAGALRVLQVLGNYTQTAGGVLVIDLGTKGQANQLAVSGTATLGGTLQVNPAATLQPLQQVLGRTFAVLTFGARGLDGNSLPSDFAVYAGTLLADDIVLVPTFVDRGLLLVGKRRG